MQSQPSLWPDSIIHSLGKSSPESLREEDSQETSNCRHDPHDEDRSRQPVLLQQVQEEADDAAYPGHQGAGADRLVPDSGGEELSSVDVDNPPDSTGSEFS